jgi:hypothetical protein
MFYIVFVFSCILQVLKESIKFQYYNEVGKLTFGKIQLQINFEFKKREVGKIRYSWNEFRMSMYLHFNHNFMLKYRIMVKLAALES